MRKMLTAPWTWPPHIFTFFCQDQRRHSLRYLRYLGVQLFFDKKSEISHDSYNSLLSKIQSNSSKLAKRVAKPLSRRRKKKKHAKKDQAWLANQWRRKGWVAPSTDQPWQPPGEARCNYTTCHQAPPPTDLQCQSWRSNTKSKALKMIGRIKKRKQRKTTSKGFWHCHPLPTKSYNKTLIDHRHRNITRDPPQQGSAREKRKEPWELKQGP